MGILYQALVIKVEMKLLGLLALGAESGLVEVDDRVLTDFSADNIDGQLVNFKEAYEGRVAIVVNVASEWGYALDHYPQLQSMFEEYESDGLSVLGFPCNQFGNQEPGTNEEIKAHVTEKYGITFDMFSKIDVRGDNQMDLYKWMINSEAGGGRGIRWNFTNFVINRCGQVVSRHEPQVFPETFEDEIKALLEESVADCQ